MHCGVKKIAMVNIIVWVKVFNLGNKVLELLGALNKVKSKLTTPSPLCARESLGLQAQEINGEFLNRNLIHQQHFEQRVAGIAEN